MALAAEAPQQPAFVLSEQLEIFTSCTNLPKLNTYVIISQMDDAKDQFMEISKTEAVCDNQNPEYTKQIIIDYRFEEIQLIRFEIFESETDESIGKCEFTASDLATADGSKLTMKLQSKTGNDITVDESECFCIIRAEEVNQNNDEVRVQFSAKHLPQNSGDSPLNPYLQIYRKAADSNSNTNNNNEWMCVTRTSSIHKTTNPEWPTLKIAIQRLCNADYNREILIKCFHDNDGASPQEIGYCKTSLRELLETCSKLLKNPVNNEENCGTLIFHCEINQEYRILQYLRGGMEIQLIIGIDFTASNGDPKKEESLHYIGRDGTFECESPYMRVMQSVGRVLEPYDADGMIECYGFGANIDPFGKKIISHCFNLTLNDETEVCGIEGVLEAYKGALQKIQLYGPTCFNEIIASAAKSAAKMINNEKEQNYIILLIIADGIVNDMQKTIDEIVKATELPLSIVIVGVGDADFSGMVKLDADNVPLMSSNGVQMKRDIVQFVPFTKFKDRHFSDLSKEVLEEIPAQIVEYMKAQNLSPLQKGNVPQTMGNENKRKHTNEDETEGKTDENETFHEPPNKKQRLSHQ